MSEITTVSNEQLANDYDQASAALNAAAEAFATVACERFRRAVRQVAERMGVTVTRVNFDNDTWDNGVFLTLASVRAAEGGLAGLLVAQRLEAAAFDSQLNLLGHDIEAFSAEERSQMISFDSLLADLSEALGPHTESLDI